MIKIKSQFAKLLALLLVVCLTFFTVYAANSQQLLLDKGSSKISVSATSKYKSAREVLSEIGIAKRYDMHFDHSLGVIIGNGSNSKLYARFRKMFVREVGWKYFQDAYTARLAADFSEDELKELLKISKRPVMKKLLQSESKAYTDTSKQRFKMGFELWDNYNAGKVNLPAD